VVVATSALIAFRLITRAAAPLEVPHPSRAPHHLNPTSNAARLTTTPHPLRWRRSADRCSDRSLIATIIARHRRPWRW
jgi:hypothetical protein